MMGNNKLIVCFITLILVQSCATKNSSCHDIELTEENVSVFVMPYSTSSIIENEMKRGLLENNDLKKRSKELEANLHLKIRIVSNTSFNESQRNYLQSDIKDDIKLMKDNHALDLSLFLNESSINKESIAQYLIAFSDSQENEGELKLLLNFLEIGIQNKELILHQTCFE